MVAGEYDIEKGALVRNATMALLEEKDTVMFDFCGERLERKIKTIEQACKECKSSTRKYFKSDAECMQVQAQDSEMRGFKKLICPQQMIEPGED